MEWSTLFSIDIIFLLALLSIGMPVAIAFSLINIISLLILRGPNSIFLLINSMFDVSTSFSLVAIPLYILLGEILFHSNAVNIIFDAVDKNIGSVRARLFIVTFLVSTIFAALSGSAIAVAAMLGVTILPEMIKRGYNKSLIAGTICAGANLAPIIPPSILVIVVGMLAQVSIARLLLAGVVPGLIISSCSIIYILIRVKLNPEIAPDYDVTKISFKEKIVSLIKSLPFTLIIFLVLGLILLGVATPTESAATGVIGAIIVSFIYNRKLFIPISKSVYSTMRTTGMILLIMASSKAFSQIFAISGASAGIVEIINNLSIHPLLMLAVLNLIPLILCCFMDQTSLLMILVPIYLPIVRVLSFDPIWFWILILINVTIGGMSPPFGYVLFSLKGAAGDRIKIEEIYKGVFIFIIIYILVMILIVCFPEIALWLPSKI